MGNSIELSVIVTAHNEGLIAHKTMLSIFRALALVEKQEISYEIIVHIDNGDSFTKEYFSRYEKDKRFTVLHNNFGDLGISRNCAVQQARGKYLSFIDADDLASENWYLDGLNKLRNCDNSKTLLHAEANLTFGIGLEQPVIQLHTPSTTRECDALSLIGFNRWHSFVMGLRQIFLDFPYEPTKNGYGHEDWMFNIRTVEHGIKHDIVERSILFYRRKPTSLSIASEASHVIQPYSALFDFEYFRNITVGKSSKPKKRLLYRAYKSIRNNDKINMFITPIAKPIKQLVTKISSTHHAMDKFSRDISFVYDEWSKINTIENLLYPTKYRRRSLVEYRPETISPVGLAYREAMKNIKRKPDYVFLVPWIVRGGADKVLLNYLKAIKEVHPDWYVVIITTLPADNKWQTKLIGNASVVDFGNISTTLYDSEKEILFSRIITQLQCRKLHIINSEYAYLWAINHSILLKEYYDLRVSVFSHFTESYNADNGIFNYSTYLMEIYPAVKHIFTDNKNVVDVLGEYGGFSKEKFSVHYQPVLVKTSPQKTNTNSKQFSILWASRISEEKRPELLVEIARRLDPKKYHIDIYGSMEAKYNKQIFSNIPNVTYRGAYDGFESLPVQDYDVFLYTSGIDGMPNIVLEMMAAGMPIITSDAGGVGEVVKNNKTGIFVKSSNPDDFMKAIKFAKTHPKQMREFAESGRELLQKQHAWGAFCKKIREDF